LVALTVDRIGTAVEGMHTAIARPWFQLAGPAKTPLRHTYETAISAVYGSVRAIARGAGRLSDGARVDSTAPPTLRSDSVQAFANAVWGDELARRGSSMAIDMAVRSRDGAAVPLDSRSLSAAFPSASGRIVILLHGLGQTERCFEGSDTSSGLARAIESSRSTPVLVRYNTGRSVTVNGGELADLVAGLIDDWPTPVDEVALVGFSMGGLVARAAIDAGIADGERWIDLVRHVVTIAAPHAGSPIEKAVEVTSRSLMVTPQTRPLGGFLGSRSSGIRDLRTGIDLPPSFDGVEHHVIAAVLTASPESRIGSVVGDLVVRPVSATGQVRILVDNQAIIGGRRHFDILDDPSVVDRVIGWIEPARVDPR
jgi:pimeloyl-ACP methyl ester carboxylesterase